MNIELQANGQTYTVLSSLRRGDEEYAEWKVILQDDKATADLPICHAPKELTEEEEAEIIGAIHRNGVLPYVASEVEPSEWDCTGRWCPQRPVVERYSTCSGQDPMGDPYFETCFQIHVSQHAYLDV